jgi:hypothetical protein
MLLSVSEGLLHEDAEVGEGLIGGWLGFPFLNGWFEFAGRFEC